MNLAGPATRRPPPLAGQSRARPAGAWTWVAAAASLVLALTAVSSRYRLEQYSPRQLGAYFRFLTARGPGWPRVMRGYGIVVAGRRQHPGLVAALRTLPGWRVVYSGPDGLVAERLS